MKPAQSRLLRLFITGVLAALPLAATVLVVGWSLSILIQLLGPGSAFGTALSSLGLGVAGSELLGYLLGIGIIVVLLIALGALVELGLQRSALRLIDRLLRRIPIIHTVWDLAQRITSLLDSRKDDAARAMDPVWCTFGGNSEHGGATVLALLSSPDPVMVNGRACLAVLVPTAPVPVGGGLLFVPREWVHPARLGAEAVTSIYVSMGVTAPQYLPSAAYDNASAKPTNTNPTGASTS